MKRITTILVATLLLLIANSCKKEKPYSKIADSIYGTTWLRNYPTYQANLVFKEDYNYDFLIGGNVAESGTYTTANASVTLTTTGGDCIGKKGTYNYLIQDSKITIILSRDSCDDRSLLLPGGWIK